MKNLFILIIYFTTITSCINQTTDNSILNESKKSKEIFIAKTDTIKAEINTNFPFGCDVLKKIKFPKHWESDPENYGLLDKTSSQEFDDIVKCFADINLVKTIKSPSPKKLELIQIGDAFNNAINLNKPLQKSIDSCRFRLPNIGIYECYYSYNRYGNLILLNPKTNTGKLLNIYADDLGDESHVNLRYFYLDKNEISIYEATYSDDGCSLDETYKIKISLDGRINIKKR